MRNRLIHLHRHIVPHVAGGFSCVLKTFWDFQIMKWSIQILATSMGLVLGLALSLADVVSAQPLTPHSAFSTLGGSCPDDGCEDKTCDRTGCTATETTCDKLGATKCRKTVSNNFARCAGPGKKKGYTCSETSGGGCVSILTGDQTADSKCPEANCKNDGGSCGSTKYTCTDSTCPT